MKPQNKQELVDGIKAFWAERATEEKCAKYIDHVLIGRILNLLIFFFITH